MRRKKISRPKKLGRSFDFGLVLHTLPVENGVFVVTTRLVSEDIGTVNLEPKDWSDYFDGGRI